MANEFVTVKNIARHTLPALIDNLVFPNLIYKDYSEAFVAGQGATIQVKKPVILEAQDFDAAEGVTSQDVKEESVEVTLDKLATVDLEFGAIERATNVEDLTKLFLEPAAIALAEKINRDGLALYKDIPNIAGKAGTTPSTLEDMAAVRKALNAQKVPVTGRNAVWDTEADAKFTTIPAIVNAEKSGSVTALREGSIGRIFGLDNYMSQAVRTHKKGTLSTGAKPKTSTAKGATTLTLAADSLTGTLVKGDILTILGDNYVVTADATAVSNEITVGIYPALKQAVTTATAVTLLGDHTANLAFNPNAFAFVTRPLVAPAGVESYTTAYNGISLRVVRGYDMKYKKEKLSMDVLYGYKAMYPELAVRVLG